MKRLLFAGIIGWIAIPALAQTPQSKSLNINNIDALITSNGPLFYDGNNAKFEVPKGSGKSTMFTSTFWIGGLHENKLYLSAEAYRQQGADIQAGPILNSYTTATAQYWNRVWSIKKSDIEEFRSRLENNQEVTIPQFKDILEWPAKGNVKVGDTTKGYAPFVDTDLNGIYEPLIGDYPNIKGDMMLFSVMNDDLPVHSESGGEPMKIEIHRSAYAFQTNNHLNNTILVDYKIINKSIRNYDSVLFSSWVDYDLGYYGDDQVGTDINRRMIYCYNGDNNDESPFGYGANPPAQACILLSHPLQSSMYYTNDFSEFGNPIEANHYYHLMQGKWKSGRAKLNPTGTETRFSFDGNPCNQSGWWAGGDTITPGDRRILGTITPQFLAPEAELNVTMAYVYARATSGNYLNSVCTLQDAADEIRAWYNNLSTGNSEKTLHSFDLEVYPNPSNGIIHIQTRAKNITAYQVSDITGKLVMSGNFNHKIDVSELKPGIYFIQLEGLNGISQAKKFVKH